MSKVVFCNPSCRESYICDMRCGLIYGAVHREDGTWKNWRQYAEDEGLCPYCRAQVVSRRRSERFKWHGMPAHVQSMKTCLEAKGEAS